MAIGALFDGSLRCGFTPLFFFMMIRIGIGTDLHRMTEGRPLVLGGIQIPYHAGPLGHSDGDVLIHALCDALLGAMALQDIGYHFPDTDPAYRNADSRLLLQEVMGMMHEKGWQPVNVDATVHLERPKLRPFIDEIRTSLASVTGMAVDEISVKAKTGEQTGPVGEGAAIEAVVVCLIQRVSVD